MSPPRSALWSTRASIRHGSVVDGCSLVFYERQWKPPPSRSNVSTASFAMEFPARAQAGLGSCLSGSHRIRRRSSRGLARCARPDTCGSTPPCRLKVVWPRDGESGSTYRSTRVTHDLQDRYSGASDRVGTHARCRGEGLCARLDPRVHHPASHAFNDVDLQGWYMFEEMRAGDIPLLG